MTSALEGRDSVVVLPTGGGKSLCFQAPAMCQEGLAIVVSPLISLMKDQVDALRNCGVPAGFINSTLSAGERREVLNAARAGRLKLLYAAPERLLGETTLEFLRSVDVSLIAIDEAHCISSWGHDFRPEYRQLRTLRQMFPNVGVHAYTATASERVRHDIAGQLGLRDPGFLVGSFDRPNLVYKIQRRASLVRQIQDVLSRHAGESGVIYCITRREVDALSRKLTDLGHRALPYHAGMADDERKRNQDEFIQDRVETIVATIAFGMGIDKPDVRYVIHAGMPKSVENYQQESGRAGRDGLEAECCLFFSGSDYMTWKRIIAVSEVEAQEGALASVAAMSDFCNGVTCRHRALVQYFGQQIDAESCGACDVCLGDLDLVDNPLVIGQKILSCVMRLKQRFGGDFTSMVLAGSEDQRILQHRYNELSTWGILKEEGRRTVRDWIEQLAGQGFLEKAGDYNVLEVTGRGRRLLKGELTPYLLKPAKRIAKITPARAEIDSWANVDRDLFDLLRELRTEKARSKGLPPYLVFGDAALRDMARRRPSTLEGFLAVKGVGDQKLREYGDEFVGRITTYCRENELAMDR